MEGMSANDFLLGHSVQGHSEPLRKKEPCVIVGRCADYILREREDCLNVFIHASMAARADRIVRLYGSSEKSPEKRLEEKDKRRRVYYKHYTDGDWGMSQNYHLSLDSGNHRHPAVRGHHLRAGKDTVKKLRRILIFPLTNLQNLIE